MKRLLFLVFFLFPFPVSAVPAFRYFTNCVLESQGTYTEDVCTVVETREKGGALKTRNIYSNRFVLTIKSRFDKEKGFVTWDSHNKFEYKWDYKIGSYQGTQPYTYVMPGVMLEDVSWD
jgi:hypothetical protein